MTEYVNEKCHQCDQSLTGWIRNYYTVDIPFITCPICKSINDRSAKASEWQLVSSSRKISLILLSTYWGVAYGIIFSVILGFIYIHFNPQYGEQSVKSIETLFILIAGIIPGLCITYFGLYKRIIKSKIRLQDKKYYTSLVNLGYIENTQA